MIARFSPTIGDQYLGNPETDVPEENEASMTLLTQAIVEIEELTARELPPVLTEMSPSRAPTLLRDVSRPSYPRHRDFFPKNGSFGSTKPAELLESLTASRFTGKLEVVSQSMAKTVFFANGQVVFAASSQWEDRLGNRLLDAGRIVQNDLDLIGLMFGKRRLGDALVKAGVMRRAEVDEAVSQQVADIVTSVMAMNAGDYHVKAGPLDIPAKLFVS